MLLPLNNFSCDKLSSKLLQEKQISLTVARLDKIHPEVSGNKLFKLHYFAEDCLRTEHKTLLTFGGAFSNHLVATAFLSKEIGLKCIGIVRGEAPEILSHTLTRCRELGMQLHFIARDTYKNIQPGSSLKNIYGDCTIVPEGGYSEQGAKGASLIMDLIKEESPTHICAATGTATTLAGLLINKTPEQEIISVPVIKNMGDIPERIDYLIGAYQNKFNPVIFNDYHFGGYAKYNKELCDFMNTFFSDHGIPTDFVYTAKLMYAITDKIKIGYFKKGSRIICLHTGGLQGNDSLPAGTLNF